jgi:hypothetical protein
LAAVFVALLYFDVPPFLEVLSLERAGPPPIIEFLFTMVDFKDGPASIICILLVLTICLLLFEPIELAVLNAPPPLRDLVLPEELAIRLMEVPLAM